VLRACGAGTGGATGRTAPRLRAAGRRAARALPHTLASASPDAMGRCMKASPGPGRAPGAGIRAPSTSVELGDGGPTRPFSAPPDAPSPFEAPPDPFGSASPLIEAPPAHDPGPLVPPPRLRARCPPRPPAPAKMRRAALLVALATCLAAAAPARAAGGRLVQPAGAAAREALSGHLGRRAAAPLLAPISPPSPQPLPLPACRPPAAAGPAPAARRLLALQASGGEAFFAYDPQPSDVCTDVPPDNRFTCAQQVCRWARRPAAFAGRGAGPRRARGAGGLAARARVRVRAWMSAASRRRRRAPQLPHSRSKPPGPLWQVPRGLPEGRQLLRPDLPQARRWAREGGEGGGCHPCGAAIPNLLLRACLTTPLVHSPVISPLTPHNTHLPHPPNRAPCTPADANRTLAVAAVPELCSDTAPPGSNYTCAEQKAFGQCSAEFITKGGHCARAWAAGCGRLADWGGRRVGSWRQGVEVSSWLPCCMPCALLESSPQPQNLLAPRAQQGPAAAGRASRRQRPRPSLPAACPPAATTRRRRAPTTPAPSRRAFEDGACLCLKQAASDTVVVRRWQGGFAHQRTCLPLTTPAPPALNRPSRKQAAFGSCGASFVIASGACRRTCGHPPCPAILTADAARAARGAAAAAGAALANTTGSNATAGRAAIVLPAAVGVGNATAARAAAPAAVGANVSAPAEPEATPLGVAVFNATAPNATTAPGRAAAAPRPVAVGVGEAPLPAAGGAPVVAAVAASPAPEAPLAAPAAPEAPAANATAPLAPAAPAAVAPRPAAVAPATAGPPAAPAAAPPQRAAPAPVVPIAPAASPSPPEAAAALAAGASPVPAVGASPAPPEAPAPIAAFPSKSPAPTAEASPAPEAPAAAALAAAAPAAEASPAPTAAAPAAAAPAAEASPAPAVAAPAVVPAAPTSPAAPAAPAAPAFNNTASTGTP
jgi:hypothetical protein